MQSDQPKEISAIKLTKLEVLNSTSVLIKWSIDKKSFDKINKIIICLNEISNFDDKIISNENKYLNFKENCSISITCSKRESGKIITNLKKWTNYSLKLFVFPPPFSFSSSIFPSHSVSSFLSYFQTQEDVPDAPTITKTKVLNSTSVFIKWEKPKEINTILKGYKIYINKNNNYNNNNNNNNNNNYNNYNNINEENKEKFILLEGSNANLTETIIKDLEPETGYFFQVTAFSNAGEGKKSQIKNIITHSYNFPNSKIPQNLKAFYDDDDKQAIKLSWKPPSRHVTNYKITYFPIEIPNFSKQELIDGSQNQITLKYLEKGMRYEVKVCSSEGGGWGEEAVVTIKTQESIPIGFPMNITVIELKSNSARLIWNAPMLKHRNGDIIIYEIRELSDTSINDWTTNTSNSFYLLGNLQPMREYSFQVRAYTMVGPGPWSSSFVFRTPAEVILLPPRNIKLKRKSPDQLEVTWSPVKSEEPIIYQVFYTIHAATDIMEWWKKDTRDSSLVLSQILPNSYVVRVRSKFLFSNKTSDLSKVAAETFIPFFPPLPQTFSPSFKINARNLSISILKENKKINKSINNFPLPQEDPNPNPDPLHNSPSTPSSSSSSSIHPFPVFFTLLLEWLPPEKIGISYYQISYEAVNSYKDEEEKDQRKWIKDQERVEKGTKRLKIHGVFPNTFYKFSITSCFLDNICGTSLPVTIKTNFSYPPPFPAPQLDQPIREEDDKIIINLFKASGINGPITKYFVIFLTNNYFDFKDPEKINNSELLEYINNDNEGISPIKVREKITLPPKVTLYTSDFMGEKNKFMVKITRNQIYKIFIRAFSDDNLFTSSPYSPPLQIPYDSKPPPLLLPRDSSPFSSYYLLYFLIPACFFLLIIVAILTLVTLFIRNKKKNKKTKLKSLSGKVSSPSPSTPTPFSLVKMGENNISVKSHESKPININYFSNYFELLIKNDYELLNNEYETIETNKQFTWKISNLEKNKLKNRYANVIAYDHSRVPLGEEELFLTGGGRSSITGSINNNNNYNNNNNNNNNNYDNFSINNNDYINANFIDGYCRTKAYIATQGPMINTIKDFWQMIWEQKSSVIVMLTNLEERGRVKCDQYWPSSNTELYGSIYVSLSDSSSFAYYITRTFQLTNIKTLEKRILMQFQYTDWPDQGIPADPSPFLAFIRRIKSFTPIFSGPGVVHCSAGVGRTGVFIAVDICLDRIKYEELVDVKMCVTLLRSQRNYMIQTEDQYKFIYLIIKEISDFGATQISADRLFLHVTSILEPNHVTGLCEMSMEFKKLEECVANDSNHKKFFNQSIKNKNRSQFLLPNESTRVHLMATNDNQTSDYINANFIDSYKEKKAFIATQGPLLGTCEDFWRMIWEQKSTIIVMICKLRENNKESCYQYWPEGRSVRYKYFVVDPVAQYNMPFYILREFKVTDARDGQSRVIRQFQYTEWPEVGVPPSGEGFIEFIGHIQKTKQQFGIDYPITVHCSLGAGKTGVFIALNNCLEKLRFEGIVDLFQTVKIIRFQRSFLIENEDEYRFCYQASLEYLGSFDHLTS